MRPRLLITLALILSSIRAFAYDADVHSMVVGDKALKLVETRQLTFKEDGDIANAVISPDGKWVALITQSQDSMKLCLVRTSGGHQAVLVAGTVKRTDPSDVDAADGTEALYMDSKIDWSADSKYLAVSAEKVKWIGAGGFTSQQCILVYNTAGRNVVSQPVDAMPISYKLSPTGRQIAVSYLDAAKWLASGKPSYQLAVCDTQKQTTRLVSEGEAVTDIRGWADVGQSLLYVVADGGAALKKKWLNGGDEELVLKGFDRSVSPDLKRRASSESGGIVVHDPATEAETAIVKSGSYCVANWAPTGKLIALGENVSVADDDGKRCARLNRLWIARSEQSPLNTMLVAHEIDDTIPVTWSANAAKLAYVAQGRAYVAELELQAPSTTQKLAVGLKLTEEEEKQVLISNGEQIGLALKMYISDLSGPYPAADSYEEDLKEYIRGDNLFVRPGTDTNIFKYLAGGMNDKSIECSSATPVGELDAGYSWKVVIYADGHVKAVRK